MALWDIKARAADVPVWALLGGRLREWVPAYSTADGHDVDDIEPRLRQRIADGDTRFRVVLAHTEQAGRAAADPGTYIRSTVAVLDRLRQDFGDAAEFVIDVHGFLAPAEAFQLATALEPLRPLFLEDALSVEDLTWLPDLRRHTALPLAIGELFTSVAQCVPLIAERTVDYVRCHLSMMGGFTAGVRLAAAAELFGIRFAWHGPLDLSPIGHAANLALNIASPAFGIHEHTEPAPQTSAMFPGAPRLVAGRIAVGDRPGWGVDFDEDLAARFPPIAGERLSGLEGGRRPDGSLHRP
jgi:mannonate dehydratase